MLKTILLAGSMIVAAPVVAQTVAPATPPAAAAGTTADTSAATAPQSATTPADPAATASADTATTATAAAQPAAGEAQVASAVDTQFGQYDKNADGKLDRTEFATWMVALKTASDPSTKAESPATKKWVGAAFAQADTDKNKSLDKAEVTGFLAQGQG